MIEVKGLVKTYGTKRAVDGVTARALLGAWESGRSALRGAVSLAA